MFKMTEGFSRFTRKVGVSRLKFILFLLVVVLYVLGSGAPEAGGGIINGGSIIRF